MEKLCGETGGDFRRFTSDILKTHLKIEPPDWLAKLIQMSPTGGDATGVPNEVREVDTHGVLPRFGLCSLLDLFQTGIGVADPIPRLIDLRWVHRDRARNFFPSRYQRPSYFTGLARLTGNFQ